MNAKHVKYLSIVGLTFVISGMTSISNHPKLGALVALTGGLMVLFSKWYRERRLE
ncbi:MAG: hypothetical protein R8G66_09670 [Cytophagales bacterium]|nr:hypothetical protein [Cytophagales bacterium]